MMRVLSQVPSKNNISPLPEGTPIKNINTSNNGSPSFADLLLESVNRVNLLQHEADMVNNNLARGLIEVEDLHQVVLAGEKAELTLLLTVQIRNKVIEAYQELMRMQV